MATIDEDLSALERDIRQLKIEYDMYFGGGRKRPPTEIEWRIELIVKRYGERGGDMKFGQRFRFGNLAQTYAKYKTFSANASPAAKKVKFNATLAPPPRQSKPNAPSPSLPPQRPLPLPLDQRRFSA